MEVFNSKHDLGGIEFGLLFVKVFFLKDEVEQFAPWTIFEHEKKLIFGFEAVMHLSDKLVLTLDQDASFVNHVVNMLLAFYI